VKKLVHFKPSLITKRFFPGYLDVSVINEGECFIWAYLAHLIFKDVEIWDVNCHAFIKYHGRFYDSETLRGSPDWQDLPATEGSECPPRRHSVESFKRTWRSNPRWFNTSWSKIEARARKVLRRAQTSI
jgi:hypothetical protein